MSWIQSGPADASTGYYTSRAAGGKERHHVALRTPQQIADVDWEGESVARRWSCRRQFGVPAAFLSALYNGRRSWSSIVVINKSSEDGAEAAWSLASSM
jgi:hypothetical protein